jgi:hypothetical protein
MSDKELEVQDVSEDTGNEDRLVPVAEAIRYRKRAQAAEKELAEMKTQRDLLQTEKQTLADQIDHIRQDQQVRTLLTAAGVTDLETAELLVWDRLDSSEEKDARKVIEQLRRDKGWLFASRQAGGPSPRTAGVRPQPDGSAVLQEAAKKAARSGQSADVQEYLRLRRQVV